MILVEVTGRASAWPVYDAPDLLERGVFVRRAANGGELLGEALRSEQAVTRPGFGSP